MTPQENCDAFLQYTRFKHPKDMKDERLRGVMISALAVVWSRT